MKNNYIKFIGVVSMLFTFYAYGQTSFNVPEIIYYNFDQTGTVVQNFASPGTSGSATINGTLSQSGVGQFGSALVGAGVSGTGNNIATNWPTSLTGDWTISFWLDMVQPTGTSYIFGDASAGSFRCFAGGVAPANGLVLRGGITDLQIPNVLGTGPGKVVHIVYTAATGLNEAFVDGVSVATVTQVTNLNISGSAFVVGAYSGSNGLNGSMDEFRVYNRALSAAEISSTYSQTLPLGLVCGAISNTAFSNVTSTSFDFSWDHGNGNDDYVFEYGPAGFTPGTGTSSSDLITGTSTTKSVTGLSSNTNYQVIITENCNSGNDDYTLGPLSVLTLCGTEVAPWSEDFENGGVMPTCWEQPSSNGENWKFDNTGGFNHIGSNGTLNGNTASGGYFAWVDDSSPNSIGTSLITPFVDVSALTVPMLTFYLISDNEGFSNVDFSVDVWDGAAWNIGMFTSNSNTANNSWEEIELYLNTLAITGDIQVRFIVDETNGTDFYDDIAIDDVSIIEAPTCLKPTGLVAANITPNSADLTWTENNGASTWNIEYGVAGFVQGTGTIDNGITNNPYPITLTPNTDYTFYVQTDCGGGDISAWAGPYSFSNVYCDYTVSNASPKYITSFVTNGAIVDINNQNTLGGITTTGYSDYTSIVMDAFETQLIDFTIETSSTLSYGITIYVDWNDDFVFDSSEKAYSSSGYTNTPLSASFSIPVGATVGQHRMRVIADDLNANPMPCSGNSAEAEDYTINVINPPSCLPPVDIDSVSVGTTNVELIWLELNSANSWIIEYGLAGYAQGNGTEVIANTNPYDVTGLNPSANYDFYVRSDCGAGDSSAWRGPYTVYTDCGIAIAPFYEGFNNAVQPQCWDNLSSDPSTSINNYWLFNDQGDYGAANNGRAEGDFAKVDGNSPYTDSVMLITPQIDISQLTTPYLAFEWFSNNTNNPGDNVPLIVEVSDGTSWNLLDTLQGDSAVWQFANYDLSAYSNNIIQVRFMVNKTVTTSFSYFNDILLDEVRIDNCIQPGGVDGSFDVCRLDSTVDLNANIITKPNGTGYWAFPSQPTFLVQDSIFKVTYLPSGSYDVLYLERLVCYDTTFATINVFNPSSAGTDGTVTVCMNEPINLYGALGGNFDLGGEWFDFTNTLLPNSQPKAQAIPGQYNYFYVADNGVCPTDTAIVNVTVKADCDFLALGEESFTDISVFPNPATSQLNIVNPSNTASLKVEMLDMNGRVVLVENKALNNASEATLAIDFLEKGIYTLRVYNNEGQKTFKIVKQ